MEAELAPDADPSNEGSAELHAKIRLAELMLIYWNRKAIGTIELRNWLGGVFPEFAAARRPDVDDRMEEWGEQQAKLISDSDEEFSEELDLNQ